MKHDEVAEICDEMFAEAWGDLPESFVEVVYWFAQICETAVLREEQVRKLFGFMIDIYLNNIDSPAFDRIRTRAWQLHHQRYVGYYLNGEIRQGVDMSELKHAIWRMQEGMFLPLIETPAELLS